MLIGTLIYFDFTSSLDTHSLKYLIRTTPLEGRGIAHRHLVVAALAFLFKIEELLGKACGDLWCTPRLKPGVGRGGSPEDVCAPCALSP